MRNHGSFDIANIFNSVNKILYCSLWGIFFSKLPIFESCRLFMRINMSVIQVDPSEDVRWVTMLIECLRKVIFFKTLHQMRMLLHQKKMLLHQFFFLLLRLIRITRHLISITRHLICIVWLLICIVWLGHLAIPNSDMIKLLILLFPCIEIKGC